MYIYISLYETYNSGKCQSRLKLLEDDRAKDRVDYILENRIRNEKGYSNELPRNTQLKHQRNKQQWRLNWVDFLQTKFNWLNSVVNHFKQILKQS